VIRWHAYQSGKVSVCGKSIICGSPWTCICETTILFTRRNAMEHRRPDLMIMIGVPSHGEPDEDDLDRDHGDGDGDGGTSIAHRRIGNLVDSLHREGPVAARKIRLYPDALIHLVDSFNDRDPRGMDEATEEAVDTLHELMQSVGKK